MGRESDQAVLRRCNVHVSVGCFQINTTVFPDINTDVQTIKQRDLTAMLMRHYFQIFAIGAPLFILGLYLIWKPAIWALVLVAPIIGLGVFDMLQTRQTIRRLYPFFGRFRYMLESVRPEIQQYFVESDTSGTPISREFRSLVYQRAKGDRDTRPFGTIFDVNRPGYEWINHSMMPKHSHDHDPRVKFGGDRCAKPYMV